MKVLLVPQYSMRSLTRDVWLLDRDGHLDFCLSLVKGLNAMDPEIECWLVVPERTTPFHYLVEAYGLARPPVFVTKPFARNVALERTNFSVSWWRELLEAEQFEIVLNNNESYGRGLATIRSFYGLRFRLHALYEHVPLFAGTATGWASSSWRRIEESADCSDRLFTFLADVRPVLSFLLRREVELLPFLDESQAQLDGGKERLTFLAGRLTEPDRLSLEQTRRVLELTIARGMRLVVANPDESDAVPDHLKDHLVRVADKHAYLSLLRRAAYVPVFLNPTMVNSVTYFQAVLRACQTDIEMPYDPMALRVTADRALDRYSWQRQPDRLRSLLDG